MTENALLSDLNDRSREVFRRVVEAYLTTGELVGRAPWTRDMSQKVSAATIRNVMQDLEHLGLLDHPHVSAGWMPTQLGLRLFVDGLMEAGPVSATDREMIDETLGHDSHDTGAMMGRVSMALSALTHGASLVLMPKQEAPLRHIEFVGLAPTGRWSCWSLPMAGSRTGFLPRPPATPPARCARPRIF